MMWWARRRAGGSLLAGRGGENGGNWREEGERYGKNGGNGKKAKKDYDTAKIENNGGKSRGIDGRDDRTNHLIDIDK